MENKNSSLNKENKKEDIIKVLIDEASSPLMKNLIGNIENKEIDLIWGKIFIEIETVPLSMINIEIDCNKEDFEQEFKKKLKEKIEVLKNLDSTNRITKLERNLFFGKKEEKSKLFETRNAIGGGKQVII